MHATIHADVELDGLHVLTRHAWERMCGRRLSPDAVRLALGHGRVVHVRGAVIRVVGRREVERAARRGLDLAPAEGVHVVCGAGGVVLTAYRNRDLTGLRPRDPWRRPRRGP
jgi:hypothetical protein